MVMSYRSRNAVGRFTRAAGSAVRRYGPLVAKGISKAYSAYKSQPRGNSAVDNTVSFQHDFTQQYRRKRAPKRVVRRAKKAERNFSYQLGKKQAQISRVSNLIYAPSTITPTTFANSQTTFNVGLYGGKVASSSGMNAWYSICLENGLVHETGRILCKSACLDVQIQNSDSTNVLVVDAYKYVFRRESFDEPNLEWAQALLNQNPIVTAANLLTQNSLECTPFDGPGFGSKILILGKVRYRIAPNNSVYLQMRDPRNHSFHTARFDYDASAATTRVQMFKGMTKGWIFVARSAAASGTTALAPINWKVIQTQSYRYSILADAQDSNGQN